MQYLCLLSSCLPSSLSPSNHPLLGGPALAFNFTSMFVHERHPFKLELVRTRASALNALPAHTPVRSALCPGAKLVPWRAAKSTCSLWLPEYVKTTAHFGLSIWGTAGWGCVHVQERAVGFARLSLSHPGPRLSLTVETTSVPELSSHESDTEDIHAFSW